VIPLLEITVVSNKKRGAKHQITLITSVTIGCVLRYENETQANQLTTQIPVPFACYTLSKIKCLARNNISTYHCFSQSPEKDSFTKSKHSEGPSLVFVSLRVNFELSKMGDDSDAQHKLNCILGVHRNATEQSDFCLSQIVRVQ